MPELTKDIIMDSCESEEETCCSICLGEFDGTFGMDPYDIKLDGRGHEKFKCEICSFYSHRHCIQKYYLNEHKVTCPQCKCQLNDKMIIGNYSFKLTDGSYVENILSIFSSPHKQNKNALSRMYFFLNENGQLHRSDGDYPALITMLYSENITTLEYIYNGVSHRDHKLGPAVIDYKSNNISQSYIENGSVISFEIGPSRLNIYKDDNQMTTMYTNKNYVLHRDNDLPAIIRRLSDTNIIIDEEWHINGQLHRSNNLPAKIEYYDNGKLKRQFWYIHDEKKRDNDKEPIDIKYYESGQVRRKKYIDDTLEYFEENTGRKIENKEKNMNKLKNFFINFDSQPTIGGLIEQFIRRHNIVIPDQ